MFSYQDAYSTVKEYGQEHVLQFYHRLSQRQKDELLDDLQSISFESLPFAPPVYSSDDADEYSVLDACDIQKISLNKETYEATGYSLIKEGQLAVLILAGGEGSRLGFDHPKGMLNVGTSRPLYLFEILFNRIAEVSKAVNRWIPIVIMTNPVRHSEIIRFFEEHSYFSYSKEHVFFFAQDLLPAIDYEGKIIMRTPNRLAMSPDGNGHWFKKMEETGLLSKLNYLGVKWMNVVAIDNVLQQPADPTFFGATYLSKRKCGAKVVARAYATEKVGVLCNHNSRPSIVEYFEAESIMHETLDSGVLKYRYGVILNYLFDLHELKRADASHMPIHLSKKKIPFCNAQGETVVPLKENGYKMETLIIDMIELLGSCLPYEVIRDDEFSPIKNRTGVDSLESAQRVLLAKGVI